MSAPANAAKIPERKKRSIELLPLKRYSPPIKSAKSPKLSRPVMQKRTHTLPILAHAVVILLPGLTLLSYAREHLLTPSDSASRARACAHRRCHIFYAMTSRHIL